MIVMLHLGLDGDVALGECIDACSRLIILWQIVVAGVDLELDRDAICPLVEIVRDYLHLVIR